MTIGRRTATGVRVKEGTRGQARCRGCNAPIVWFETESGKRMPFNEGFRVNASEVVQLTEGGRGVIATISSDYVHWATCPTADKFRNRGRAS